VSWVSSEHCARGARIKAPLLLKLTVECSLVMSTLTLREGRSDSSHQAAHADPCKRITSWAERYWMHQQV
jgi:hypothetical protein